MGLPHELTAMTRTPIFLLMLFFAGHAQAVSMTRQSFAAVCQGAKLIVAGTVASAELLPSRDDKHLPSMCYRLKDVEHLGKPAPGEEVRLCYLGDVQSDERLVVAGLRYPEVGERGIFLVGRPNDPAAISPLQGWNQGHFTVDAPADAQARVLTASGAAICSAPPGKRMRNSDPDAAFDLVLRSAGNDCKPVSVAAFVAQLRACAARK